MATFLITGVTGTVMGPLAALLLKKGHTIVALARSKGNENAGVRVAKALNLTSFSRLFVIQGDVTDALCGITLQNLAQCAGKIDCIIHGAASIKLDNSNPKETFQTNVEGTKNVLALAKVLGVSKFCYVSTVFVAADAPVFLETELRNGQHPRNPYEESKIQAEELVRQSGMRFTILRIPVVIGNSETAEISSYWGYYGFFGPFVRLREDLLKRRGRQEDGTILLPVHIPCAETGPLQIVPIDWVVQMMATLVEIPAQGKTFHLVHQQPPQVGKVIEWSLLHLGFKGMHIGGHAPQEPKDRFWGTIQRGLEKGIEVFRPYTSLYKQRFGNEVLFETFAREGIVYTPPPEVTPELLAKLLDYAIAHNFGKT